MDLIDLIGGKTLEDFSDEELRTMLTEIRHNRSVQDDNVLVIRKTREKKQKTTAKSKADKLLDKVKPEDLLALMQKMGLA